MYEVKPENSPDYFVWRIQRPNQSPRPSGTAGVSLISAVVSSADPGYLPRDMPLPHAR